MTDEFHLVVRRRKLRDGVISATSFVSGRKEVFLDIDLDGVPESKQVTEIGDALRSVAGAILARWHSGKT